MLQSEKEKILARISQANAHLRDTPEIPYLFRQRDECSGLIILDEFLERLRDYKAHVYCTSKETLLQTLTDICQRESVRQLVVPADVPDIWLPVNLMVLKDEPALDIEILDRISTVLTDCAMAIAQTGSLVLDGGFRQGRRALSLVADRHICVVYADQVVGLVPEAIARLATHSTRPITFISGPSATSDIEFSRVEGVHGPRTLIVCIVI